MRVKGRALAWFGAELHIGGADLGGEHSKETLRTLSLKAHKGTDMFAAHRRKQGAVPEARSDRICGIGSGGVTAPPAPPGNERAPLEDKPPIQFYSGKSPKIPYFSVT